MLAWHRFLFTIYFIAVKSWDITIATLVAVGKILVTSFTAFFRWSIFMLTSHYRGIRDISLIFSPSIITGVLFLVLGGSLFLAISVLWTVGITSLSYVYNRKKGAELNV